MEIRVNRNVLLYRPHYRILNIRKTSLDHCREKVSFLKRGNTTGMKSCIYLPTYIELNNMIQKQWIPTTHLEETPKLNIIHDCKRYDKEHICSRELYRRNHLYRPQNYVNSSGLQLHVVKSFQPSMSSIPSSVSRANK